MDELATLIERATTALAAVAAARPDVIADEELAAAVVSLEGAGRLLDGARALWAGELERRSAPEFGDAALCKRAGYRKPGQWLEALTGAAPIEVDRRMRLGALILQRPSFDGSLLPAAYPEVAEAMRAGRIGVDAASTITRHLQQAARRHAASEDLEAAERALAEVAAELPHWEVELHAKAWRAALDPDGAKPREEELRQDRSFKLGRERNGITPFWGAAPTVEAALMKAAFAESTAPDATPRFVDAADLVDGVDTRTREQRQFDVLFGTLQAGLRAPGGMRSTAQVVATVKLSELESGRGTARLDDIAEPISAFAAQIMACDAGFQTLVVGERGQPLAMGRLERCFTPAQRRAIAARDRRCVGRGCTAPPGWCHAHHVEFWSRGGLTDVENGVLLCPGHHRDLHNGLFELRMVDGLPEIRYPFDAEWQPTGGSRLLVQDWRA